MTEITITDVPVGIEGKCRLTHALVGRLLNYTGQAPESLIDCTDSGGLSGSWCLVVYTTGDTFRLPVHARQVVAAIKNYWYMDSRAYSKTVQALCNRQRNVPVHFSATYTLIPYKSAMAYSNPHYQSFINYHQIENRTRLKDQLFITPEGHQYRYGCRERAIRLKLVGAEEVQQSLETARMVLRIPLNVNAMFL